MYPIQWRRIFASLLLSLLLFVTACTPAAPSRFADAQKDSTRWGAAPAVAKAAEQGATFNRFFPKSVPGYDIVAAQEKKGFAEYKVNRDGKNVAMLSISDTTSVPAAAAKYQQSTMTIAGYPAVEQGTTATGILVNNRYQVKVLSRDPEFTASDRALWLAKFDLSALAQLKPALTPAVEAAKAPTVPAPTANPAVPAPMPAPVAAPPASTPVPAPAA